MESITIGKVNRESGANEPLNLLLSQSNLDIMVQRFDHRESIWLSPADYPDTIEFFYILNGSLTLIQDDQKEHLSTGDYFYVKDLKKNVALKTEDKLEILFVSTSPAYNDLKEVTENFKEIIQQIDEKDHYTKEHSKRVTEYSLLLARVMNLDSATVENIAIAAAFHDIGKCVIPTEILNKPSRLDHEEFRVIRKHANSSYVLLSKYFSNSIPEIAGAHHERYDGSGYPYGLKGNEIPLEARVIAVADCFDAMTSVRTYNDNPLTFEQACDKLCNEQYYGYDRQVLKALEKIVTSKEIYEVANK